jgi:hypothetical protein
MKTARKTGIPALLAPVFAALALAGLAFTGCDSDGGGTYKYIPPYSWDPSPILTPVYVNWIQIADTGFTNCFGTTNLYGAAYGNNTYVVVGQDGKAAWSKNGIYWKASGGTGVIYSGSQCNALTFVNGKFYTFGKNSDDEPYIVSSSNGDVWTEVAQTAFTKIGDFIWDITYGEGHYVMVCDGFTSTGPDTYDEPKIAWSTDLVNWTVDTTTEDEFSFNAPLYQVEYANGLFVAVGGSGGSGGKTAWSDDGENWNIGTFIGPRSRGLVFGKEKFVSVGQTGTNNVKVSTDGKNWTAYDLTWSQFINTIAFGGGKFLIGGNNQAKISLTAAANSDWTEVTQLQGIFSSGLWINGAGWGSNRFITVGDNGIAAISTN